MQESHNVPTKNKLNIQRIYQFIFVNLQNSDCIPLSAFIVASSVVDAKAKFSTHLGTSFSILSIQSIDTSKHDVVVISTLPMYQSLLSDPIPECYE